MSLTKEIFSAFSLSMLVVSFVLSPTSLRAGTTQVVDESGVVLPKPKSAKELEIEARTEQTIIEQYGENFPLLKAMREDIDRNAYKVTLNLCHGYRKFSGLGAIPVLSKSHKISTVDSFGEWMNIGRYGFAAHMQTYVNGGKMVHNKMFNRSALEFDHYFGSVYLFYLFRSEGYNLAAKDCLSVGNTGKYSQTHYEFFKKMLVAMDNLGSGVGVTASFMAAGAIISKIIYPVAIKIGLAASAVAAKIGVAIGVGATGILVAKVAIVGAIVVGAAYLLYKLGDKAYQRYQIGRAEKELSKNPEVLLDPNFNYNLEQAVNDMKFLYLSQNLYLTAIKKNKENAKDKKLFPLEEIEKNYLSSYDSFVLKREATIAELCGIVEQDKIEMKKEFKMYLSKILAFQDKEIENCI